MVLLGTSKIISNMLADGIRKLLPICMCAAMLVPTPVLAATKDDLNSTLQQTQKEQEEKQEEIADLESQLSAITERKEELAKQVIEIRSAEGNAKKDALEVMTAANETAVIAAQKSILSKEKDSIMLQTTANSAGQASSKMNDNVELVKKETEKASNKTEVISSKKSMVSDSIDSITEEVESLKEKEADIKAEIKKIEEEEKKKAAEEKAKKANSNSSGNYKQSSGGALTRSKGVVYYNGHRETYYSQRVLPGSGLRIPGRHVADDGTIRDGDDYICVAADPSYLSKGSTVETSLGMAKVYDSGCAYGTIDIYTDW